MALPPSVDSLRAAGLAAGLNAVEVTSTEPLAETLVTLRERKAAGLHGGMNFTYRNPDRSTRPELALAEARALVVGARGYLVEEPSAPAGGRAPGPRGRVARYAWRDHYSELRSGLGAVAAELTAAGWRARVLADDNALVDRAAAQRAGLGWFGKNANLLLPGLGSWFVLGSVITDAPLAVTEVPVADRCGSCTRCLDACPTGAIVAPGVVDARRCLSWLLQAEGTFPREHRAALGDRIYGCDDCQEVCPPNRRSPVSAGGPEDRPWVGLVDLLSDDDAAVLAAAGRWYVPRRDPRYLRRNALVVLGNVGSPRDPTVEDLLRRYLVHPDGLLRAHAAWAARRLGRPDLLALVADDPDPQVRHELADALA